MRKGFEPTTVSYKATAPTIFAAQVINLLQDSFDMLDHLGKSGHWALRKAERNH